MSNLSLPFFDVLAPRDGLFVQLLSDECPHEYFSEHMLLYSVSSPDLQIAAGKDAWFIPDRSSATCIEDRSDFLKT